MTRQERFFHSLYMELEDSIVIRNVQKVASNEVLFKYKNRNGKLLIDGHCVKLEYSDNEYAAILNSYQELIDVLLERNEMVKK